MPFPLAHPAAVLPLKRFCPRWLNLPALVIGSVSPDAAYLFGKLKLEEVSHRSWGIVAFCLPAGFLLTLLLHLLRSQLAGMLPEKYGRVFLPSTWQPFGSAGVIMLSLLIGTGTHLLWDSLTHRGGWAAGRIPMLETSVGSFAGHTVRLCRVLWYGSSFAGVACVYLVYRNAQQTSEPGVAKVLKKATWLEATLVAALVLPIELVHDLVRGPAGGMLVALLSFLLVMGVVWRATHWLARTRPAA